MNAWNVLSEATLKCLMHDEGSNILILVQLILSTCNAVMDGPATLTVVLGLHHIISYCGTV